MSELFPSSFVEAIRRLRMTVRRASAARDAGEHGSRINGAGLDFRDFRPYAPGDDLRRVDWNAYRRSGRLITRVYEEPRRVRLHVLVDLSDSMFFEDVPRADAARRVAAAIAAAAAEQHDPVSLHPFGAQLAEGMTFRGLHELPLLFPKLEQLRGIGRTDLARALRGLGALRARPGVLVIISDFFDPAGLEPMFAELSGLRHRVVLVRLLRQSDREPPADGDLELIDCETDAPVRVSVNAAARNAYRESFTRFETRLAEHAARRQAQLVAIDVDAPIITELERLFIGGALRL